MQLTRTLVAEQLETRRLLFNPTGAEQELLQLVNRFRSDPAGEFSRLIRTASPITARDPVFQDELDFFRVNGNTLRSELQALNPVPPLAWNPAVYEFSAGHNAKMIGANPPAQFHSNTAERRQALLDAGVDLRIVAGETIHSENVYGYAKSPLHLFAGFVVDWGAGSGGMQTDRPHRRALSSGVHDQIGHVMTPFSGSNFGPLVATQVLVNIESPPVMVVGAVFEDRNDSGWYEAGEGLRNVTLEFSGPAGTFTTRGLTAGGYQIELPPGTYTARATGGGMAHPTIVNNVVVGESGVWQNLIYDPDAIPPDSFEPNNGLATATITIGRDQTFNGLSIHTRNDVDLFSFVPASTGAATIQLQFSNTAGNLDLQLLNATGSVIASSASTGNTESIDFSVTRGVQYYVRVDSVGSATNGSYRLSIDAPEPQRPVANHDRVTVTSSEGSVRINVLGNDIDPDGDRAQLVPRLSAGSSSSFALNATTKWVTYTVPGNVRSGFVRGTYTVSDDQDLQSSIGNIDVMVVNFSDPTPWQNNLLRQDINGDGVVSALDVLIIINDLNANGGARQLPTSGSIAGIQGLFDASGDGVVSPTDILVVINQLNRAAASGEGPPTGLEASLRDQALVSLILEADEKERRLDTAAATSYDE